MVTIENESLKAIIKPKGAELCRLFHKQHEQEYLWNGDERYWPKHSPILFPIVGALKNDTYYHEGRAYSLPRHGFARDMDFTGTDIQKDRATFSLESNEETLTRFPFDFVLKLHYILTANKLKVSYEVNNPGQGNLYFSIGGHPAFAVPLEKELRYEDYYLEFEQAETAARWPISNNLIAETPDNFLNSEKRILLNKELFYQDAIVLKNLVSQRVSLRCGKADRGLHFNFAGFPYLGIWAAKDAPFVCIEPWCGIADSVNHNQQLDQKEGIMVLGPNQTWMQSWQVECL